MAKKLKKARCKRINKLKTGYLYSVAILTIFLTGISYIYYFNAEIFDLNCMLLIKKDEKIGSILTKLGNNNRLTKSYFMLTRSDKRIKPGLYELNGVYSLRAIARILTKGEFIKVRFTIVEGYTTKQIKEQLEKLGICTQEEFTAALSADYKFRYKHPADNYDGYFFPDTYFFSKKEAAKDVISSFLRRFEQNFPYEKYGNDSFYSSLIMASIIEKEAGNDKEKALISSVFYNRLKRNKRLESCATVAYVVGNKPKLTNKDLYVLSPYNTYRNKGLPPTPISNPGKMAILSAFSPITTNYFYFVADDKGNNHFAENYEEHLRLKKKYK